MPSTAPANALDAILEGFKTGGIAVFYLFQVLFGGALLLASVFTIGVLLTEVPPLPPLFKEQGPGTVLVMAGSLISTVIEFGLTIEWHGFGQGILIATVGCVRAIVIMTAVILPIRLIKRYYYQQPPLSIEKEASDTLPGSSKKDSEEERTSV